MNHILTKKRMDEDDINDLIQGCKTLKSKFRAENKFPRKIIKNSFLIVNAATAENVGTHWLLLCRKNNQLSFACRFPWPAYFIEQTPISRIISLANNHNLYQLLENQPIQSAKFKLYGLFAFILLSLFSKLKNL